MTGTIPTALQEVSWGDRGTREQKVEASKGSNVAATLRKPLGSSVGERKARGGSGGNDGARELPALNPKRSVKLQRRGNHTQTKANNPRWRPGGRWGGEKQKRMIWQIQLCQKTHTVPRLTSTGKTVAGKVRQASVSLHRTEKMKTGQKTDFEVNDRWASPTRSWGRYHRFKRGRKIVSGATGGGAVRNAGKCYQQFLRSRVKAH